MAIEIKMPKLGQTTDDVRIVRWLIGPGDAVKKGDPICEVETDKTTMELESFASGTVVSLIAGAGDTVLAGEVIATLGGRDEKAGDPPARAAETLRREEPERAAGRSSPRASPMVQRLAEKRGIDIARVRGTGPGGIVTLKDLDAPGGPAGDGSYEDAASEEGLLSEQQRRVAQIVTLSKSRVPHYYLHATVYCEGLLRARGEVEKRVPRAVSIDAFFVRALGVALTRHPRLNASFSESKLAIRRTVGISVAVAVGEDLFTPVIQRPDVKSIVEIDGELRALVDRAKAHGLRGEDLADGSFTLSNLGMFPIDSFEAIINPPQIGTLAVGTVKNIVAVEDGAAIRVRPACVVTASYDHRAVNGAQGAAFLAEIKSIIETELGGL